VTAEPTALRRRIEALLVGRGTLVSKDELRAALVPSTTDDDLHEMWTDLTADLATARTQLREAIDEGDALVADLVTAREQLAAVETDLMLLRDQYPENGPLGNRDDPPHTILHEIDRLHRLATHRLEQMTLLKREVGALKRAAVPDSKGDDQPP
jgi:hypothetical protein